MRDLVERQAVIDAFDMPVFNIKGRENAERVIEYLKAVLQRVRKLPSAQPEIIRCKDCLVHGVCRFEQGLGLDGYCSKAERREE